MVPDVGEDFTQQRNLVLHHTKHPKPMTQEHRQAPRSGMIMTPSAESALEPAGRLPSSTADRSAAGLSECHKLPPPTFLQADRVRLLRQDQTNIG